MILPSVTISVDAYDKIYDYTKMYGRKIVIIGGKQALAAAEEKIKAALSQTDMVILETLWYGGESSFENVDKLMAEDSVQEADMIFAVGGGRACDAVKCLADKLEKPVFTFPTIISNCAPSTALCIMYTDEGVMAGYHYMKQPAKHVFADSQIVAEAPYEYIWAGIGDALSKEPESHFAARGSDLTYTDTMGLLAAEGCNDRLIQHGEAALEAAKKGQASEAIEVVAQEVIITTALTSVLVNHDFNTSVAHAFYYGSTAVPACQDALHGAVVSYGVLLLLTIDQQYAERDKLYGFMQRVDLPTRLADFGLTTEAELDQLLDKAMQTKDLKVAPYKITREMFMDAITEVEGLAS